MAAGRRQRPARRLRAVRNHLCAATAEDSAIRAAYARAERFTNVAALHAVVHSGEATVHWLDGSRFWWLRRWTEDGRGAKQFMSMEAGGPEASPLFDHGRLAQALADGGLLPAAPEPWALPFSSVANVDLEGDSPGFDFTLDGRRCRCDLSSYACSALPPPEHRPIDAGVPSPDGAHYAFVRADNLWLRTVASGAEVALSHDGRPGYAYATPLASPDDMVARPNARFRLRKRRCGIAHRARLDRRSS